MYTTNSTFNSYGTTVFELMSRLAVEHKSINLGQGFPDDYGPNAVLQKASEYLFDLDEQSRKFGVKQLLITWPQR